MGPLKAIGLCALLVSGSHADQNCGPVRHISSPLIDRWQPEIAEASRRFGIPDDWIRAVMKQESAGLVTLNGQPITSRAGAMGLMQLMPETWIEMRDRYGLGRNPYDLRDNIFSGVAYLREMYDRYGYPNLFAAYHAGPGRMDAFLVGKKPLPDATFAYVKAIVPDVEIPVFSTGNGSANVSKSSPNSLFIVRSGNEKSLTDRPENDGQNARDSSRAAISLFIPLTNAAR